MGWQRVGHDWVTFTFTSKKDAYTFVFAFIWKYFFNSFKLLYYLGHLNLPNLTHTHTHTHTLSYTCCNVCLTVFLKFRFLTKLPFQTALQLTCALGAPLGNLWLESKNISPSKTICHYVIIGNDGPLNRRCRLPPHSRVLVLYLVCVP